MLNKIKVLSYPPRKGRPPHPFFVSSKLSDVICGPDVKRVHTAFPPYLLHGILSLVFNKTSFFKILNRHVFLPLKKYACLIPIFVSFKNIFDLEWEKYIWSRMRKISSFSKQKIEFFLNFQFFYRKIMMASSIFWSDRHESL